MRFESLVSHRRRSWNSGFGSGLSPVRFTGHVVEGTRIRTRLLGLVKLVAFIGGPLVGEPRDAILWDIQNLGLDQTPAGGANLVEVIVGQGKIPIVAERRNLTNIVGDAAVEIVVRQIEILNALQAAEGERDGAGEWIFTDIKDDSFFEVSDFRGQAAVELVPEEENFGEVGREADTLGNGAGEVVVGESEVAGACGAEILGEALCEVVVVDEDDVEIPLEELVGNWAGELIEAEVQEY